MLIYDNTVLKVESPFSKNGMNVHQKWHEAGLALGNGAGSLRILHFNVKQPLLNKYQGNQVRDKPAPPDCSNECDPGSPAPGRAPNPMKNQPYPPVNKHSWLENPHLE